MRIAGKWRLEEVSHKQPFPLKYLHVLNVLMFGLKMISPSRVFSPPVAVPS